jgi:cytochrome c peroxidase
MMTLRVLAGFCGRCLAIGLVVIVISAAYAARSARGDGAPQGSVFTVDNESGAARTIGVTDFPVVADSNPFFQDLGVNGRRCVTCHRPAENMTVSAAGIRARFDATGGLDPILRTNDGSNSPLTDVSTLEARRTAYSLLLGKGLIRVGLPTPADAEFELVAVDDPAGYAGNNANGNKLSLFRRPLPATNLTFMSTVMWDGRETLQKGSSGAIHFDLMHQANSATQGHAEAPVPLDDATRETIFAYEMGLFTAQVFDRKAGALNAGGAQGGPEMLSTRTFTFGVNDPLGCDPTGANCNPAAAHFDPIVFTEFNAWAGLKGDGRSVARAAVARGQALFNTLAIPIRECPASTTISMSRSSSARAPRVTIRRTRAIIPSQRHSTSASPLRRSRSPKVAIASTTHSVFQSATCRSTRCARRQVHSRSRS